MLNSAYARGSDLAPPDRQRAFVEFVARFGFPVLQFTDAPGVDIADQRDVRQIQELACSFAVQAAVLRAIYSADVTGLLAPLTMPVLVTHARGDPFVPFEAGRDLAARIPHAKFVPFAGSSIAPWAHGQVLLRHIRRFLGVDAGGDVAPVGTIAEADSRPKLTPRELEVLWLVAQGMAGREIAAALTLSVRTVERHISNIYGKTGARTRAQATAYVLGRGLLPP